MTNELAAGRRRGAGDVRGGRAADLTGGTGDRLGTGRTARGTDPGDKAARTATRPARGSTAFRVLPRAWRTARFTGRHVAASGRARIDAGTPVVPVGEMATDRPVSDLAGVPEVAHRVSVQAPPTAPAAVPSIGIALAEDGGAGQPG